MNYQNKLKEQINQYADIENMHDLPEVFHFWSKNYIVPAIREVFGCDNFVDIYFNACVQLLSNNKYIKILSIGCGDGTIEIELADKLLASGYRDFQLIGVDLSPILLKKFQEKAKKYKNAPCAVEIVEGDLNQGAVTGPFDVIIANHALHHILELESLFNFIHKELSNGGIFATVDMIGRNGHMRWPETYGIVRAFWSLLSKNQQYHAQLKRTEPIFYDWDCSGEGFEGIRAQDILPLILKRFYPSKFIGVGGFIDVFLDRSYGHGFDSKNDSDIRLIKCIAELNEHLLDINAVKPTIMFAHFTKVKCEEKCYRDRNARQSVRDPLKEIKYYGVDSEARVENWGPCETPEGTKFNIQSNGLSAIWVKVKGVSRHPKTHIRFGGNEISGQDIAVQDEVVTFIVRDELIQKSGSYEVAIIEGDSGRKILVGEFLVRSNLKNE